MTKSRILIVDDDLTHLELCREVLKSTKAKITCVSSGREALALLAQEHFDLVVSDLLMPDVSGLDLLVAVQKKDYPIPVIIVTGYADIENVETCVDLGSFEYIAKPYDPYILQTTVQRALQDKNKEVSELSLVTNKKRRTSEYRFPNIIGKSAKMEEVFAKVDKVAESNTNVCIYGGSGTGKELIARAIHYHSPRKDRPLVTLDCTAIPEGLMESEMFGHVRGAFTSAATEREGVFELADTGTLFLDEIGELSLSLQAKLLRVIQCREFRKVGGSKPLRVDVRIIAATNKDLRKAVREGTFREDLFYRIDVISIVLPSLRDRKEDIPLLVDFFIKKFNRVNKKHIKGLTSSALSAFLQYEWPGNVRELENCIESLVVMAEGGYIDSEDLTFPAATLRAEGQKSSEQFQSLSQMEQVCICHVLRAVGGNKRRAARILQISPATLYHKLREAEASV